ncbi:MAG: hypothetical protein DMG15_03920 [Acidobacteria bacterium]|nr:MAG: hypothetical protein DMG16_15650 [Acidobacteriota bacterium]PYS15901.1 MAG: hypothetical protein DMG15_03920 [Acidobacteriota bacterium]
MFHDLRWYPIGKVRPSGKVRTTFGVFVPHFRELRLSEPRRELDQGRPKPPMNIRDFVVNQLADQDLGTLTNTLRCPKKAPRPGK